MLVVLCQRSKVSHVLQLSPQLSGSQINKHPLLVEVGPGSSGRPASAARAPIVQSCPCRRVNNGTGQSSWVVLKRAHSTLLSFRFVYTADAVL